MLRFVGLLIAAIIAITMIRSVIGVVMRLVASLIEPNGSAGPRTPTGTTVTGGQLKRDPVCGVYVSPDTAVKARISGEEIYFCSESCRVKYKA